MKLRAIALLLSAVLLFGLGQTINAPSDEAEKAGSTPVRAVPEATVAATLSPTPPSPVETTRSYVVTEYKSEEAESFLWDCISRYSPSDQITAGILAMFWRESFFRSDSTAHWNEVLLATGLDQPEVFTAEVDAGLADGSTRDLFVDTVHYSIGGYGLGQWYGYPLLDAFYDFACEWGTSIADAEMQCAFTVQSLEEFSGVWDQLIETNDPRAAGYLIALHYDGTRSGADYISEIAELYYDKYAKDPIEEANEPA